MPRTPRGLSPRHGARAGASRWGVEEHVPRTAPGCAVPARVTFLGCRGLHRRSEPPEPEPEPEPEPTPQPVRLRSLTVGSPPPHAISAGGDSGDAAPGSHVCPKGHEMKRDLRAFRVSRPVDLSSPTAAAGWCAVCGASGTQFYCPAGCLFDMCAECWGLFPGDVRARTSVSESQPASPLEETADQHLSRQHKVYDEVLQTMERCATAYAHIPRDARGHVTPEGAEAALLELCMPPDERFGPPVLGPTASTPPSGWLKLFVPSSNVRLFCKAVALATFGWLALAISTNTPWLLVFMFLHIYGCSRLFPILDQQAQLVATGARPGDLQRWTRWVLGVTQPVYPDTIHNPPLYANDTKNFGKQSILMVADPSQEGQSRAVSESMFLAKCLSLCAPRACDFTDVHCHVGLHSDWPSGEFETYRHWCSISFSRCADLLHAFELLCTGAATMPKQMSDRIDSAISVEILAASLHALTFFHDETENQTSHSVVARSVSQVRGGKTAPLAIGDFFATIFALACDFNDSNWRDR